MYGLILMSFAMAIPTVTGAYTIDTCRPTDCRRNSLGLDHHLQNFRRSLHHLQYYFTIRISNLAQANMFDLDEHIGGYDEPLTASPFNSNDTTTQSMLVAYSTLTDLQANLTLFNCIKSRRLVNNDEFAVFSPLCHLYKAMRSIYMQPPNSVCRITVSAPSSTRTSITAAVNFVEFTLRRGRWLTEHMRHHFETIQGE